MAIVVGYLATAEGRAALEAAVRESRLRSERVVVVVSTRQDEPQAQRAEVEQALAQVDKDLDTDGVDHEIRLLDGGDVADDLIGTAEETGAHLVVIGGIVLTVVGTMLAVDPNRKG